MQSQLEMMNDQLMVLAALLQSRQETALSQSTASLARSPSSAAPSPYTASRTFPTAPISSSEQHGIAPFAFSPSLAKKSTNVEDTEKESEEKEEKEIKESEESSVTEGKVEPAQPFKNRKRGVHSDAVKKQRDRELMKSVNVTMRTEKDEKESGEDGGLRLRGSTADENTDDDEDPEKLRLKRLLRFSSSTL